MSEQRISVLLVCGSFTHGGTERNVIQIATGLDASLFAVKVLGLTGVGPLRRQLERCAIETIITDWSFDPRKMETDSRVLEDAIKHVAPDIVHVFNYPAIYFAIPASVQANVPIRIAAIQARDTWKGLFERFMDRLLRPGISSYLVDGEGTRQFILDHQKLDPVRVHTIYDGPDLNGLVPSLYRNDIRKNLGLAFNRPVVGVVGRLQDSHKGQSVLLRSIAILPKEVRPQCVLVGDGEDEGKLRTLVKQLELTEQVLFAGPHDHLGNILHALDILIIPSLRYESVPKILLEGMAASCAIVASYVGDIPEFLVDKVTGLLVKPGDPSALAEAIGFLAKNPDAVVALGSNARTALIEKGLTLDQSISKLSRLYGSLTNTTQAPPALMKTRMRFATSVYRLVRLWDQRVRWMFGIPPRQRR